MTDRPETPAERRERNRRILAARSREKPTPWATIAAEFEISERQARRGAKDAEKIAAEERDAADVDAERILHRIIDVQTTALDEVEKLMADADNSNARVGACRAAGSIGSDLRDSLAAAGLLPGRIVFGGGRLVAFERQFREAVGQLIAAAVDHGLDPQEVWPKQQLPKGSTP
jgi:hypothetical protein